MESIKASLARLAPVVLAFLIGAGIAYSAPSDSVQLNVFGPGDLVSSDQINANFSALLGRTDTMLARIEALEKSQVPSGAIMAFVDACPTEWLPVDGSVEVNNVDLRGVFLRGGNSFGLNADGEGAGGSNSRDPGGDRTPGNYQDYQVGPHTHGFSRPMFTSAPRAGSEMDGLEGGPGFSDDGNSGIGRNGSILSNGGSETRPRNVAVIFCMKK